MANSTVSDWATAGTVVAVIASSDTVHTKISFVLALFFLVISSPLRTYVAVYPFKGLQVEDGGKRLTTQKKFQLKKNQKNYIYFKMLTILSTQNDVAILQMNHIQFQYCREPINQLFHLVGTEGRRYTDSAQLRVR